jgi:cell division septation protein DedD
VDEPRTHYQISVTARQAVGLFVGLLLSLGLAFFFGLMTGLSGREGSRAGPATTPTAGAPAAAAPEAMPPVETAVPLVSASRAPRRDEAPAGSVAGAEPTPPPTLQTFEDGTAEEAAALPPPHPAATARPSAAAKAPAPGGRIWVQVASLSNRTEAEVISVRLSKRGYHTQVVSDRGRLRVRVGPYRTTEDARRVAERLRRQEKIKSPWVVSEGK